MSVDFSRPCYLNDVEALQCSVVCRDKANLTSSLLMLFHIQSCIVCHISSDPQYVLYMSYCRLPNISLRAFCCYCLQMK